MAEWCPQVPLDRRTDRRSKDYCGVPKRLPDGKLHRCHKQPGHDGTVHACWCGPQLELSKPLSQRASAARLLEPGANPRCRYYPGVQSGGILCHRAQRRELFSIGPSHPAAGCIGFSTMATAINAMRVPDTLATPTRACAGGIGSRVDAEGAARVQFPIFPRDSEDVAEILLGPSWRARNMGSRSATPTVTALSSSARTSTTPREPRRAAQAGCSDGAGGRW